jgi:hypothetical protein
LKQAPRAWYSQLSTKLCALRFTPSKADTSLFYFNNNNVTIFGLVYVDDIIVASSNQKVIEGLLCQVNQEFALKDLGNLHYFLSIEVPKVTDGTILSQEKYASHMLQ